MTMAARKHQHGAPDKLVPFTFRIPEGLVSDLDTWVSEQNARRHGAALTRSDVIRGVLAWASKNKPEWEEGRHVLVVVDRRNRVLVRQTVNSISGTEITFSDGSAVGDRIATFVETKVDGDQVISVFRAKPIPSDDSKDALDDFIQNGR